MVYTGITAYERALEELSLVYGFTFEKLWGDNTVKKQTVKSQDERNEYIADERYPTPEYLEWIRNMTPEEFERHIEKLKEEER